MVAGARQPRRAGAGRAGREPPHHRRGGRRPADDVAERGGRPARTRRRPRPRPGRSASAGGSRGGRPAGCARCPARAPEPGGSGRPPGRRVARLAGRPGGAARLLARPRVGAPAGRARPRAARCWFRGDRHGVDPRLPRGCARCRGRSSRDRGEPPAARFDGGRRCGVRPARLGSARDCGARRTYAPQPDRSAADCGRRLLARHDGVGRRLSPAVARDSARGDLGGGVAIETWLVDHAGRPNDRNDLAGIARDLAFLDPQGGRPARAAGPHRARNVRLHIPRRTLRAPRTRRRLPARSPSQPPPSFGAGDALD